MSKNLVRHYQDREPEDWQCPKCGEWNAHREKKCVCGEYNPNATAFTTRVKRRKEVGGSDSQERDR